MSVQVLSDETRDEMRRQADNAMTSALYEYCPSEFLMLLKEYELLLNSVKTLSQDIQNCVYEDIERARKRINAGVT